MDILGEPDTQRVIRVGMKIALSALSSDRSSDLLEIKMYDDGIVKVRNGIGSEWEAQLPEWFRLVHLGTSSGSKQNLS